jgi:hypothetical protein
MVNKELENYIKENLKIRSFYDIKKDLVNAGWKEGDIDETLKELTGGNKKSIGKIILIILLCFVLLSILVCAFLYYYLFIVPTLIEKPVIEKPELVENNTNSTQNNTIIIEDNFGPEHIIFLLNEMGAYKLQSTRSGEIPKIKFIISDVNKDYYLGVIENKIVEINESNPDIIIRAKKNIIISVYNSNNTKDKIIDSYNKGLISIEILADTSTLLSKGYSSLYLDFGMTGNVVAETSNFGKQEISTILIVLLVLFGIILIRVFIQQRKV